MGPIIDLLLAGYFVLLASGVVRASKDAEKNKEWLAKYRPLIWVGAAVMGLLGLMGLAGAM